MRKKKEWNLIFKEVSEIIGLNIQVSPVIALLNLIKEDELVKENKDLIVIMITAARIIFARSWRNDNITWRNGIENWDMAINDKLTCDMKISRGQMKNTVMTLRKYGMYFWNMHFGEGGGLH